MALSMPSQKSSTKNNEDEITSLLMAKPLNLHSQPLIIITPLRLRPESFERPP